MRYRTYGDTGCKVSLLGFGAMRLPVKGKKWSDVDYDRAVPLLQEAYKSGINVFDSHHNYHGGNSEVALGMALSEFPRDSYYIQTKNPHYRIPRGRQTHRHRLEKALKKLKTDYIDFYLIHSTTWETYADTKRGKRALKEMRKAKDEGLVKHVGMSTHDNVASIKKLIDTGEFEMMLCQYSLLLLENIPVMNYARKKGMGVSVMGPVAGGRLAPAKTFRKLLPGRDLSGAEAALLYVFGNRSVSTAFSGMSTPRQLRQNLHTVNDLPALTAKERKKLDVKAKELKKLCDLYCTGCRYCMPCPHGIAISTCFEVMNWKRVYGFHRQARKTYEWLAKNKWSAEYCKKCGKCMSKCPQGINIIAQLEEVARVFGKKKRR
jgi:predicted aldo/keto reductase-like oxidoreductase